MFDTGAINEDSKDMYQFINPHSYEGFPNYDNNYSNNDNDNDDDDDYNPPLQQRFNKIK